MAAACALTAWYSRSVSRELRCRQRRYLIGGRRDDSERRSRRRCVLARRDTADPLQLVRPRPSAASGCVVTKRHRKSPYCKQGEARHVALEHDRFDARRRMSNACVLNEAAQADSDGGEGAGAGSKRNGHRSRIWTVTRTHFASPPRGQGTQGCQPLHSGMIAEPATSRPTRTPLVRALALHGVSGQSRKPLGLNP